MKYIIALVSFFFILEINANNHIEYHYHLIDTSGFDKMQYNERQHLEKVLKKFHATEDELLKIKFLQDFTENSYDFAIWPKYNNWIYVYCMRRLLSSMKPEKKRKITLFLAGAINNKGFLDGMHGNVVGALGHYKKALGYYKDFENKEGMATLYTNIGSIYESQGLIKDAVWCYNKGVELCLEIDKKDGLGTLYNNLGVLYKKQGDMNLALEFYKKGLDIFDTDNDKAMIATTLNNMAVIYDLKTNRSKFLECIDKSLHLYLELGDQIGIATAHINMGSYHSHEKQSQKTVYHYLQAIDIYSKLNNQSGLSKAYAYLATIKYDMDSVYIAKKYAVKALKIAQLLGYPSLIEESADLLSKIEVAMGNYKEALSMSTLSAAMRDSIYQVEILENAIKNKTKSEFEKALVLKKQEEKAELDAVIQKNNRRIIIQNMLIFFGILLFFGGIISLDYISISPKMAEGLIFIAFLLLFEFILVLFDPSITEITEGLPIYKLCINTLIVLCIFPIHSLAERSLKKRVVFNIRSKISRRTAV
jgi:tetratricopeptide (TPR) repeat protein